MLKILWSNAFGLKSFSLPASDHTARRYSLIALLIIALEDMPQLIILFVYSNTVTGWSVTAAVSGAVGILAVILGAFSYFSSFHKSHSSVNAEGFGGLKLRSQKSLNVEMS